MIKNYNKFIKESFNGFRTIGEYIESISKDNDYALNIISQYTKDIDPTVKLANAVNLLPKSTQELILKLIINEKTGKEEPKEADVIAYTSVNLNESFDHIGGKKLFQCFLKVITALGQKEISNDPNKCTEKFLFLFFTNFVNFQDVKSVMSRYQFFENKMMDIEYTSNTCNLYYGIKVDGKFEYGLKIDGEYFIFGQFPITQSVLKNILMLTSPSSKNLKKQIVSLTSNQISLLGKIKQAMNGFIIGNQADKLQPTIIDNIITFGYFKNQVSQSDIDNVKSQLKSFLIPFKWSDQIQINVNGTDNHLFLNLRVK